MQCIPILIKCFCLHIASLIIIQQKFDDADLSFITIQVLNSNTIQRFKSRFNLIICQHFLSLIECAPKVYHRILACQGGCGAGAEPPFRGDSLHYLLSSANHNTPRGFIVKYLNKNPFGRCSGHYYSLLVITAGKETNNTQHDDKGKI